jgi:hypothetical protein
MIEVLTFRYFPSLNLRHLSPVKNGVVGGAFIRHIDIQEIKSEIHVQTGSPTSSYLI